MINEWIAEYNPKSNEDIIDALREIMQQITLAALSRTDFYDKAAFYGGTALRIFYGLGRFSEDLEFSLLEANHHFSLEPYFDAILKEFEGLGMKVSIREKEKKHQSNVESAFLKSETLCKELILEDVVKQLGTVHTNRPVKIKIEVDRVPPLGFSTEEKLLIRPFSFYTNCFSLPSLFAGKMHALLFRKWKNRVKGRDWYDLEWYIKKGIPLDLGHFAIRAKDTGDWPTNSITREEVMKLLQDKIEQVSIDNVREDVIRFIKDDIALKIWSKKYFKDIVMNLKFQ